VGTVQRAQLGADEHLARMQLAAFDE
jgi:hypothetical protein